MESLNCCRTCLSIESLNPIYVISDKCAEYSKVISAIAGIKVEENDSLPQVMCAECIKFINRSIKFQQECKFNQNVLMDRINNSKMYNIKEEPPHVVKCENETVSIDISHINDATGSDEQTFLYEHSFEIPIECSELEQNYEQDSMNNTTVVTEMQDKSSLDCVLDRRKVRKNTRNCKSNRKSKGSVSKRTKRADYDVENYKPTEENDTTKESGKQANISTKENANGKIECEYCHKVLSSKLSLRNHYKIHTGFDVVCEHCGKKFITRRLLLMHCRAKHGYEKTDKCSYCDYRASNAEQVKIHERLHTGERPFECGQCTATFHRKSSYLQHIATHLPDKNVPCEQCPARFKSVTLMRIHRNRHRQPQYSFKCYVCQSTFARRRNVVRHLQRIHAILSAEPRDIEKVKIT